MIAIGFALTWESAANHDDDDNHDDDESLPAASGTNRHEVSGN